MNWTELHRSPLWRGLWDSEEIAKKEAAIRHQLLSSPEIDPHTLGRLRGQLAAFAELKSMVEGLAQAEQNRIAKEQEAATKKTANGARWSLPRIR